MLKSASIALMATRHCQKDLTGVALSPGGPRTRSRFCRQVSYRILYLRCGDRAVRDCVEWR
jgi:hypothetical protein